MYSLFADQLLLAQARGGAGNPPPNADFAIGGMLCFYGVVFAIAFGIQILFLMTMSKCLQQVAPRNRRMEPGQVWLCLIPIFGFIWTIMMILRVSESLQAEYEDRGMRGDGDFGRTLGIVYIVSAFVCGIVAIVCFIMYWVKIAGYKNALMAAGSGGYGDYDDDDDDDRPRRKKKKPRRRDDDDDDYEDDDDRDDRRRRDRNL